MPIHSVITHILKIFVGIVSQMYLKSHWVVDHEEIINEINIELGHADLYACKVPIYTVSCII